MLPSVVFTHRNAPQLAAFLPAPAAIRKCAQPAFSTADQQDRPSLTTLVPGAKSRSAILSTSFLRGTVISFQPGSQLTSQPQRSTVNPTTRGYLRIPVHSLER